MTFVFPPRYKNDEEKFKQKVKESVDACREEIMNPDPSDPHSVKYVVILHVVCFRPPTFQTGVCWNLDP